MMYYAGCAKAACDGLGSSSRGKRGITIVQGQGAEPWLRFTVGERSLQRDAAEISAGIRDRCDAGRGR